MTARQKPGESWRNLIPRRLIRQLCLVEAMNTHCLRVNFHGWPQSGAEENSASDVCNSQLDHLVSFTKSGRLGIEYQRFQSDPPLCQDRGLC
ncbi:hypothetical protein BML2537_42430 (plasmid) [Providencia stuartii]|nr:hypothetical protein BML2537_42430 [Providencia stuartii]